MEIQLEVHPGERWRHYKGGLYQIVAVGVMEANGEAVVIYTTAEHIGPNWVRPLANFLSTVTNGHGNELRFTPVPGVTADVHPVLLAPPAVCWISETELVGLNFGLQAKVKPERDHEFFLALTVPQRIDPKSTPVLERRKPGDGFADGPRNLEL